MRMEQEEGKLLTQKLIKVLTCIAYLSVQVCRMYTPECVQAKQSLNGEVLTSRSQVTGILVV
jgi:hypothetical protein